MTNEQPGAPLSLILASMRAELLAKTQRRLALINPRLQRGDNPPTEELLHVLYNPRDHIETTLKYCHLSFADNFPDYRFGVSYARVLDPPELRVQFHVGYNNHCDERIAKSDGSPIAQSWREGRTVIDPHLKKLAAYPVITEAPVWGDTKRRFHGVVAVEASTPGFFTAHRDSLLTRIVMEPFLEELRIAEQCDAFIERYTVQRTQAP